MYGVLGLVIFVEALASVVTVHETGSMLSGGLTLAGPGAADRRSSRPRRPCARSRRAIREAAYGVGATRWEVIRSHVLPSAAPGILTGGVLTLARAFGETAPLLLVGGRDGVLRNRRGRLARRQLARRYTALPMLIFDWTQPNPAGSRTLAAAAIVVLLVILLLVNGDGDLAEEPI